MSKSIAADTHGDCRISLTCSKPSWGGATCLGDTARRPRPKDAAVARRELVGRVFQASSHRSHDVTSTRRNHQVHRSLHLVIQRTPSETASWLESGPLTSAPARRLLGGTLGNVRPMLPRLRRRVGNAVRTAPILKPKHASDAPPHRCQTRSIYTVQGTKWSMSRI